jgi:hypothetical protein
MISGAPISSTPISTSVLLDNSGGELFIFTLQINKVVLFTLKLL